MRKLQVDKDDDLPQNLCSVCIQKVIQIHDFQEKCRQNQTLFKIALTEPESHYEVRNKRGEVRFEFTTNQGDSSSKTHNTIAKRPEDSSIPSCSYASNDEFASTDELENENANKSDKICRTCLSTEEVLPIFDLKYKDISIVGLLDSYFVHVS